jgi:hypothetical protein
MVESSHPTVKQLEMTGRAAMAIKSQKTPRSLDASALRNCLLENHAVLDPID